MQQATARASQICSEDDVVDDDKNVEISPTISNNEIKATVDRRQQNSSPSSSCKNSKEQNAAAALMSLQIRPVIHQSVTSSSRDLSGVPTTFATLDTQLNVVDSQIIPTVADESGATSALQLNEPPSKKIRFAHKSGSKPFQCSFCLKVFGMKASMLRHVRNLHKEKFVFHSRKCLRRIKTSSHM